MSRAMPPILEKNHRARSAKTKAQTPALLKGLIRCGHCQTNMGITFARKRGRMYRYYHCLHASKHGYDACPVRSVAAGEIERTVIDRLRAVFRDPEMIARTSRAANQESAVTDAEIRDALYDLDTIWDELFPAEQARIVALLVASIIVHPDGLTLGLRENGLRSLALEASGNDAPTGQPNDDDTLAIQIPMRFKRRDGQEEIIVPDHGSSDVQVVAPPQEPLVLALAQAFQWQEMLDTSKARTAGALAKRLKVSKAYVTRTLRLTNLAPDIIEAILLGREHSGLSLGMLTKPLPLLWDEQRRRLGFAAAANN